MKVVSISITSKNLVCCVRAVFTQIAFYSDSFFAGMKYYEENNINTIQANATNSEKDSNRPFDSADAEKGDNNTLPEHRKSCEMTNDDLSLFQGRRSAKT